MKAGYKMQTREERNPRLLSAELGVPLGEAFEDVRRFMLVWFLGQRF